MPIQVVVKVRPINEREREKNRRGEYTDTFGSVVPEDQVKSLEISGNSIKVWSVNMPQRKFEYNFTTIMDEDVSQIQAFERIARRNLDKVLKEGTNLTLFAYGQSGCGKSFTFFGKEPEMYDFMNGGTKRVRKERADIELPPENLYGLIPRSLTYIFAYFQDNVRYLDSPMVRVGFYEIYNNHLYDLLTTLNEDWECFKCHTMNDYMAKNCKKCENAQIPARQELEIMDVKAGTLILKKGGINEYKTRLTPPASWKDTKEAYKKKFGDAILEEVSCKSIQIRSVREFFDVFIDAQVNRTVKATELNPFSSRGHCINFVKLRFSYKEDHPSAGATFSPIVTFGDLAGSEKLKKKNSGKNLSKAEYQALFKESMEINASLSKLAGVINKMSKKQVPSFRSSKLTHCLKDAIAGNTSLTVVIAASGFYSKWEDTKSSLNFGRTCKKVPKKAARAERKYTMKQAVERIKQLEAQLNALEKSSGLGGSAKPFGPNAFVKSQEFYPDNKKAVKKAANLLTDKIKKYIETHPESGLNASDVIWTVFLDKRDDYTNTGVYFINTSALSKEALQEQRDTFVKNVLPALQEDPEYKDKFFIGEVEIDNPVDPADIAQYQQDAKEAKEELARVQENLNEEEKRNEELEAELSKMANVPSSKAGGAAAAPAVEIPENARIGEEDTADTIVEKVEEFMQLAAAGNPGGLTEQALDTVKLLQAKLHELNAKNVDLKKEAEEARLEAESMAQLKATAGVAAGGGMHAGVPISEPKSDAVQAFHQDEALSNHSVHLWRKLAGKADMGDLNSFIKTVNYQTNQLYASMNGYFNNVDNHESREAALDELFSGTFDQEVGTTVLDRPAQSQQYRGIDDAYANILVQFSPTEMQMMKNLENVDDIYESISSVNEQTGSDLISYKTLYKVFTDNGVISDKGLITKIHCILDSENSGLITFAKLLEFVDAVSNFHTDEHANTNVIPIVKFRDVIQKEEFAENGKLNTLGAKQIIANLRGGVVDPGQIRDEDLGVQYISDLYEHQLRELFMDCPESTWNALTKFHRFEALIVHIEKQPSVNPFRGTCTFEQFLASFQENDVTEEGCSEADVLKEALSQADINPDRPIPYLLAFNALVGDRQSVIDMENVPRDKTTFPTQNLSRHVPLEVALEAYKRDNEMAHMSGNKEELERLKRQKEELKKQVEKQKAETAEKLAALQDADKKQQAEAEAQINALQGELSTILANAKKANDETAKERQARKEKEKELEERMENLQSKLVVMARMKRKHQNEIKRLEGDANRSEEEIEQIKKRQKRDLDRLKDELEAEMNDESAMTEKEKEAREELNVLAEENERLLKQNERNLENQQKLISAADARFARILQEEAVKEWKAAGCPPNSHMEQLCKQLEIEIPDASERPQIHQVNNGRAAPNEEQILADAPDQVVVAGAHKRRINGTYYKKHKSHDGRPYYEKTPDADDSWLIRWSNDSGCWVFNDRRDKMYTNAVTCYAAQDVAHPGLISDVWQVYNGKEKRFIPEFDFKITFKEN